MEGISEQMEASIVKENIVMMRTGHVRLMQLKEMREKDNITVEHFMTKLAKDKEDQMGIVRDEKDELWIRIQKRKKEGQDDNML